MIQSYHAAKIHRNSFWNVTTKKDLIVITLNN